MAKAKKIGEAPKAPKEKESNLVTLYDANEKAISVPAETAEDLLKLNKGYRRELPGK